MDSNQVAHDLTIMFLRDKCSVENPEELVIIYKQTFDKIYATYKKYSKEHLPKGEVLSRAEWGI